MKKGVLIILLIWSITTFSQTTYTWNVASGSWTTATSWSPSRSTPATNDILIFDGSVQATPSVTGLPASETFGKLIFQNNVTASFSASAASSITISGGSGDDFIIESGSELSLTGTSAITINIGSGATGIISGTFRCPGTAAAAHKLLPTDASSLTISSGGSVIQGNATGTNFSGNLFGNSGTSNAVIFQSGSSFYHRQGSNPFALTAPASRVVFQSGSTYYYYLGGTISTSGRTYANLVVGNGQAPSNTGTASSDMNVINLTLESGATLNINTTSTGKINISGNITQSTNISGGLTLGAGGGVFFNGTSTQTIGGSGTANLTFPSSTTINSSSNVTLSRNIVVNGSITVGGTLNCGSKVISGTGSFTLSSGATIKSGSSTGLNGNITTSGTNSFNSAANYEYNGSSAQVTGALLPTTVNDLTINNLAGVTLSGNVTVNGTLTLTAGTLSKNGKTLTISGSVSTTGTGGIAETENLNAPSSANVGGLGVLITSSANLGNTTVTRGYNSLTANGYQSIKRWYKISPTNNTGLSATLVFPYNDTELNGITESNLGLFKSTDDGATWTLMGGTVNESANTVTLSGIDGFSLWTLADVNNPFPVTLTKFTASVTKNNVTLNWSTATETQNAGWEVERRIYKSELSKAENWKSIAFIDGSRNSNAPKNYSFTDYNVAFGQYEYRLKQIDLDGSVNYSDVILVSVGAKPTEFALYENYPNPFNPSTKIRYAIPQAGKVTLAVYNSVGQLVATLTDEFAEAGIYEKEFDGSSLSSGVYVYMLMADNVKIVKKMLLVK